MTQLVRIGNSQGIRIPKPLIEQADLEGKELKLQLVDEGLLITSEKAPRDGWERAIKQAMSKDQESLDADWLDMPLDADDELEW